MKTLIIAALAIVCALGAWAAVPSYINEQRLAITLDQVRSDVRFTAMAMQFGLPYDVLKKNDGVVANLRVKSSGKFRWGLNDDDAYAWPAVTPEESAAMPGVEFRLTGANEGFFIHCSLGANCDRRTGLHNVIVFYGQYPPRDGLDGRDGFNGRDGANGANGRDGVNGTDGANGTNGRDTQVVTLQAAAPVIYMTNNNFSVSREAYPSPQMGGMSGPIIVSTNVGSVQPANNISAVALSNAEAHQNQNQEQNQNQQQQQQQEVAIDP